MVVVHDLKKQDSSFEADPGDALICIPRNSTSTDERHYFLVGILNVDGVNQFTLMHLNTMEVKHTCPTYAELKATLKEHFTYIEIVPQHQVKIQIGVIK